MRGWGQHLQTTDFLYKLALTFLYLHFQIPLHTDVTMYEPRSPLAPPLLPPLPPPSPPFGSRFLVTGVGMSEGRVGVVDEDDVVVGVVVVVVSALLFLGLGV